MTTAPLKSTMGDEGFAKKLKKLEKLKLKIETMKNDLNIPKTRQKPTKVAQLQNRKKRPMSAQRVTLFKHPAVLVNMVVEPQQRVSSTDTVGSGESSSGSSRSETSSNISTTGTREPLEIYEIKTMDGSEISVGCYLSLGKNDKVVRPILPRLRVCELEQGTFHIHFSSPPSKYWELVIPAFELTEIRLLRACFSKICQLESDYTDPESSEEDAEENTQDSSTDELELLLESSSEEDTDDASAAEETSDDDFLLGDEPLSKQQIEINNLFRNTISRFQFQHPVPRFANRYLDSSDLDISGLRATTRTSDTSRRQKRYSSYELVRQVQDLSTDNFSTHSRSLRDRKINNRRSISFPMEFH